MLRYRKNLSSRLQGLYYVGGEGGKLPPLWAGGTRSRGNDVTAIPSIHNSWRTSSVTTTQLRWNWGIWKPRINNALVTTAFSIHCSHTSHTMMKEVLKMMTRTRKWNVVSYQNLTSWSSINASSVVPSCSKCTKIVSDLPSGSTPSLSKLNVVFDKAQYCHPAYLQYT